MHSGHLDLVRGRQSTVSIGMSELLGDSTLALGDAIADLSATIPFTTSAGLGHHRCAPRETVKIQRARSSTVNASKYHTVNP